jgi:AcrR family transcriptional regulator
VETREKILQEGFRLFLEKGYRNVSLSDLVEAVGVTKGGFYHHFKSKDELYIEVMHTYFIDLFDSFIAQMEKSGGTVRSRLEQLFRNVGVTYDQLSALVGRERFRGIINMLFSGIHRFDFIIQWTAERYQRMIDRLAELIETGKQTGEVYPGVDAEAAAFHGIALGEGIAVLWSLEVGLEEREERLSRLFESYWRGIAAER